MGRSDEALLASAWAGQRSVSVLVNRYRRPLARYAAHLLDDAQAGERVVEHALGGEAIMAAEHVGAPSARAVLYGLVHKRLSEQVARQPRERDTAEGGPPPRRGFMGALAELAFEQRTALWLREVEGLSRDELAYVLALSVPATKRLLVDARIALAEASTPSVRQRWWTRLRHSMTRGTGR